MKNQVAKYSRKLGRGEMERARDIASRIMVLQEGEK